MSDRSTTVPTTSECENRTRRVVGFLRSCFMIEVEGAMDVIVLAEDGETIAGDGLGDVE